MTRMSTEETRDWAHLAREVRTRRAHLQLTQAALHQRSGLSIDRIQLIELGKRTSYRLATLAALERALGWKAGSVEAVLAGGSPTVEEDAAAREARPRGVDLAPGVRELHLPPGMQGEEVRFLELRVPGRTGHVIVSWTAELPEDLIAMRDDILAQSRLLARRVLVQQDEDERERAESEGRRNGTDG